MATPTRRGAPAVLPGMRPPPPVSRNPPPAVMADAGGIVRAAPGMARSDAGQSNYLYETWWGFCPFVGSANQMVMGRTNFQKCVGGMFFIADCTLVGGPMIRGMLWGLRATASAGLRLAAKGAGTVLKREALLQFANMGGKVLARAEAEALITRELAKGHVLLIGAETSKGGVQHSVAYIIEKTTNTIYKLHGGLTQLAKLEAARLAKATITGTVGRMNTMQVFNLAKSPAEVWEWWSRMAATEAFSSFMRGGMPRGCAGTVVLILERLAGEGAITGLPKLAGAARWLPMYLDKALGEVRR